MRASLLAFSLALIASGAAAQTADLDRLRMQDLQQGNMRAQEQANILRRDDADVRQAIAEQQRRQTQANAQALDLRTAMPPPVAPVAAGGQAPANDDALRQLQDRELAASNARLRAITPAP